MNKFMWAIQRSFHHRRSKRAGQGLVEFALAIPVLLLIVLGVIEGGRLLYLYSAVTSAAREAARWGAASDHFTDCSGIVDAATRIGSIAGIGASNVEVSYDSGPGSTVDPGCPPPVDISLGDRIIVRVTVPYELIVPLVQFDEIPIEAEDARTIIHDLEIVEEEDPSVTEPPSPVNTLHIENMQIVPSVTDAFHKYWKATVTITVHNKTDGPLAGADVIGAWSGRFVAGARCRTDSSGVCTLTTDEITHNGTVTYTVSLVHFTDGDAYGYDPGATSFDLPAGVSTTNPTWP